MIITFHQYSGTRDQYWGAGDRAAQLLGCSPYGNAPVILVPMPPGSTGWVPGGVQSHMCREFVILAAQQWCSEVFNDEAIADLAQVTQQTPTSVLFTGRLVLDEPYSSLARRYFAAGQPRFPHALWPKETPEEVELRNKKNEERRLLEGAIRQTNEAEVARRVLFRKIVVVGLLMLLLGGGCLFCGR